MKRMLFLMCIFATFSASAVCLRNATLTKVEVVDEAFMERINELCTSTSNRKCSIYNSSKRAGLWLELLEDTDSGRIKHVLKNTSDSILPPDAHLYYIWAYPFVVYSKYYVNYKGNIYLVGEKIVDNQSIFIPTRKKWHATDDLDLHEMFFPSVYFAIIYYGDGKFGEPIYDRLGILTE